jgi:hypothetical protein
MGINEIDYSLVRPITPKSLKEVKSTGLKDLKALCKDAGINIGGAGREALEILLCIELGIRTSGVDVGDDFGRKIPKCVHHMLDDQHRTMFQLIKRNITNVISIKMLMCSRQFVMSQ